MEREAFRAESIGLPSAREASKPAKKVENDETFGLWSAIPPPGLPPATESDNRPGRNSVYNASVADILAPVPIHQREVCHGGRQETK